MCYFLISSKFILKIMTYFSKNSVCDICGLRRTDFKNAFMYKQHYELHEDLELPCINCPKTFPNKRKLKEHERQTHWTEKQCDICEQKFSNQSNLIKHKTKFHLITLMSFQESTGQIILWKTLSLKHMAKNCKELLYTQMLIPFK